MTPEERPAPYGAVGPSVGPPETETSVGDPHTGEPPASTRADHSDELPRGGLTNDREPRRRVASTAAVVGLAVSLAGWGWFASENARESWWAFGQHVAVESDDQGWATVGTVGVRLTGVETATEIDGIAPPAGFEYLALDLEVEATDIEQYRSCTVEVLDEQGRLFLAGREVPNGDPYTSELMCGTSDPEEDPVPGAQSVLVLIPVGAEPVSVRVDSGDFPAATFVELPVPS